jgi:LysR family transcriptional regulator, transcriptional activator for dmlA
VPGGNLRGAAIHGNLVVLKTVFPQWKHPSCCEKTHMAIELDTMRTFAAVAATANLTAAAHELGITPAAVSKHLTRLEAQVGARLLVRTNRGNRLTEEGGRFADHCRAILAAVEEAAEQARAGQSEPRGTLRVASPVALGRNRVAPLLARFAERHLAVQTQLCLTHNEVDVLEGSYDLVLRVGTPGDQAGLIARKLLTRPRILCAAPALLQRLGAPENREDLDRYPLVLLARSRELTADPLVVFSEGGRRKNRSARTFYTNSADVAHTWALLGVGVTLATLWEVEQDLRQGRLIEVLPGVITQSVDLYALYPHRRFLPARTRSFLDLLVKELG